MKDYDVIFKETEMDEILEYSKEISPDGKGFKFIKASDNFEFECQQCGRCCMNRRDIILSPFDIYQGAKYLNISCVDFIQQYTYRTLGRDSKIPIVLLDTDETNKCPFLKFDYKKSMKWKCSINPAKPMNCANHPIGIIVQGNCFEKDSNDIETSFIKVESCDTSKVGVMQNVGEWMKNYLAHEDECNISRQISLVTMHKFPWRDLYLISMGLNAHRMPSIKDPSDELLFATVMSIVNHFIMVAYSDYDTDKPFCEQCKTNISKLERDIVNFTKAIVELLKHPFQQYTGHDTDYYLNMAKDKEISLEQVIATELIKVDGYQGLSIKALDEAARKKNGTVNLKEMRDE